MNIILGILVLSVLAVAGLAVLLLPFGIFVVQQGSVAVITTFGKYSRVARPGLSYRIPIIQKIQSRISVQNRSMELSFQAITQD